MPSMRGILISKIATSGGLSCRPCKSGGTVIVFLDGITLRFHGHPNGGENVAVVIDQGNRRHLLVHSFRSLLSHRYESGTNCGT